MAISSVTMNRIDTSLSEMVRLSVKKDNAREIAAKVSRGREELADLVRKINDLRSNLNKIKNFSTSSQYSVSRDPAIARSLAMGLTYDSENPANDDPSKILSTLDKFSGVSAGTIEINGVSISIDPGSDSINDIVSRINGSGAGVTAEVDVTADRLVLTATRSGSSIQVDDGSTGFMSAAGLVPKNYAPGKTSKTGFSDPDSVRRALDDSTKLINDIIFTGYMELDGTLLGKMKGHLVQGLKDVYEKSWDNAGDRILRTGLGFTFDLRGDSQKAVIFDYREFDSATDKNFEKVRSFLTAGEEETSYSTTLLAKLSGNIDSLVEEISGNFAQGVFLDVKG